MDPFLRWPQLGITLSSRLFNNIVILPALPIRIYSVLFVGGPGSGIQTEAETNYLCQLLPCGLMFDVLF